MSTQETISAKDWVRSYARRVAALRWHRAKAFAVLNFNLLCRPKWAGKNVIAGDGPADLLHALKYFSKTFALAFLIYVVAGRFKLYEGESQWRDLVMISLKVLIAVSIVYLLTRALPERITFSRLLQAALYVGGAYVVAEALVSVPVSWLSLIVPSDKRQIDVFATEYERCLANDSIAYWLLRGDLKFFLYSDAWRPADWAHWFLDNYYHFVAVPFLVIFALMLAPARRITFVFVLIFTGVAFVAGVESVNFAKRQLGFAMARWDTKCTVGFIDQVTKNYAPTLIAPQIAYKINNDSMKSHTFFAPLGVFEADLVLAVKLKPGLEPTWEFLAKMPPLVQQSYCSDSNIYWITARRINSRLAFIIQKDDDTVVHKQLITPKDCTVWPSSPK